MLHYNVSELINTINKYFDFDKQDYFGEESFYSFFKNDNNDEYLIPGFRYVYGATKLCLIPIEDSDYVIKIPFFGNDESYEFYGAKNSQNNWDYCLTEAEIYNKAVEDGIDFLFAETHLFYSKNGFNFYIQQRCSLEYDIDISKIFKINRGDYTINKYSSRIKDLTNDFSFSINKIFVAVIYKTYGEEIGDKFFKFLYHNDISDLHSGNCGFTVNNKPILIDFSSYNESSDYDEEEE